MITVIQTTSDGKEELEELLSYFVENNLAACGHIEEAVASVYVWDGDVKHSDEYTLRLKTTADRLQQVQEYITSHHSYDLPEITWWEVNATAEYEKWVEEQVS